MTEFIIVTPIILLLLFGAFQFALIYHAKTALNYAAFEAARFGAVSNARKTEMENAFARAMAAIYTHDDTPNDVICARETVRKEIESGFVNIEVVNPTMEAFDQLGIDADGDVVIPNDNLKYRSAVTASGMTIQDANLLKIRVGYCYPLYVPYINRVLGIMLTQDASESCPGCTGALKDRDSFERRCLENGRFPVNAQAIVRMQSPAMLSAVTSSSGPGIATTSREPFYQCDKSSFEVKESLTPPDITRQTGFWTLNKQTGP
jgi:Flp pilus assembly protein TadG